MQSAEYPESRERPILQTLADQRNILAATEATILLSFQNCRWLPVVLMLAKPTVGTKTFELV